MKGSAALAEILEPYAEALMAIAQSENLLDQFAGDMSGINDALDSSPELAKFLASPIYGNDRKKAVLSQAFGHQIHPTTSNFLMLLVDRQRIAYLGGIAQCFQTLVRQLRGLALAEITSAVELNDSQRAAIVDKVKAMTGSENVELRTSLDPAILGGVIIKVGSQVLDSSVRGQLRRLGVTLSRSA